MSADRPEASDLRLTEERVREERLRGVDQLAHWLYFAAVVVGGLVAMLALIALLDAST